MIAILAGGVAALGPSAAADGVRRFQLSDAARIDGAVRVAPDQAYTDERGYGFVESADATKARLFVLDLPEGNYDVSLRFGSETEATSTTVKAETRRLVFRDVETRSGEFVTRKFTVNVRQPEFGDGNKVRLKNREYGPPMSPSWDGQLSLEFNGDRPGVVAVEVAPNPEATTLFLAGDSTVTDQRNNLGPAGGRCCRRSSSRVWPSRTRRNRGWPCSPSSTSTASTRC